MERGTLVLVGGGLALLVGMVALKRKGDGISGNVGGGPALGGGALSTSEVYALARSAGFPPDRARMMVAIAMRESGLDPSARCTNCFPGIVEDSVGLWQINMHGALGQARLSQFGISSADELLDPYVNARAAYLTWGGNDNNLEIAWRINTEGAYQYRTKYLQNLESLPELGAMELAYNRGGGEVLA